MIERQLRVLLLHKFRDRLSPQSRSRKDVCLVDRVHGQGRISCKSALSSNTGNSLNFGNGIGCAVHGHSIFACFLAVAEVYCGVNALSQRFSCPRAGDSQIPPISSRTTMISVPLAISGFNGECASNDSEAKFAGRMLAYRPSAFRSLRRPCSGRTGPTPHLGPPTAPRGCNAEQ